MQAVNAIVADKGTHVFVSVDVSEEHKLNMKKYMKRDKRGLQGMCVIMLLWKPPKERENA